MYYIRKVERSEFNKWFEASPRIDKLCGQFLDTKDGQASVYGVQTPHQEARVLAALHQHKGTGSLDRIACIRMSPTILVDAGVGIQDDRAGNTLIEDVDRRHATLCPNDEKYSELVDHLLAELNEGSDLVRMVAPMAIAHHLRQFLELPNVDPAVRENCERILNRNRD